MEEKFITQARLAAILGVKKPFLSNLLAGRGTRPSAKRAAQLEKITGIDLRCWLFGTGAELRQKLEARYGVINSKFGRPRKTTTGETAG